MKYSVRDFIPLIAIFGLIGIFTGIRLWSLGYWDSMYAMRDFMGAFFIVFGTFKIVNLNAFVEAYSIYDIIAQRSTIYAYIYPFIELGLGIAYLWRLYPVATNSITLVLMIISSTGVAIELSKQKEIMCACLGTVFKIPMTYVTLLEDILMGLMAFSMLIMSLT